MKLTVLGGFLGSGKTTWLRHQLHEGAFADAFIIVNEAAEMPVDDVLLGQSSRLAVLAGGCACCAARGALIALLRRLADERSRTASTEARLADIVLETSGLADPGAIVDAIHNDPVLVHHIAVRETIVAVDALYALDHLRRDPLGRAQVEVADRLVVTKVDEAGPEALAGLAATLRRINPGAAISGAVKGSETPLPPFEHVAPEDLPGRAVGGSGAAAIFPTKLAIDESVDWTAFSVWLSALLHARGDDVVRVKGVVRTPAGRLLLQSVRKIVQSPEILPEREDGGEGEDNAVVVIGRGYRAEDLRRSLAYFAGTRLRA